MKDNERAKLNFLLAEDYQQNEKFAEALEKFNMCLCDAETGSSYIFPSLVNRSKIYYQVKQYRKCLQNLNWAKEIKPIDDGCHDLLEMIKYCEAEVTLQPNQPNAMDFFELTMPVNEKVPFVSACLELKENEIYGRHFITTKDLNPGDVLVAEEPFFKVLSSKVYHLRCCICCSSSMLSLIACSKCARAMFCSNKCQSSLIHQRECNRPSDGADSLKAQLLQRMFYQAINVCGSVDHLKTLFSSEIAEKTIMDFDFSDTTERVNDKKFIQAVTALDKREPASGDEYIKIKKIVDRLMAETGAKDNFINIYLIQCLKSLTVNFFHFLWSASNTAEGKGLALCTLSAFFAHSCDPNIEKIDVDNKFIFTVRKPIKAGEQLNMCYDRYSFTNYSLEERQRYLNDVYNFKCNCTACVNDYPQYKFIERVKSIDDAKQRHKINCEFIKDNISLYPSQLISAIMDDNVYLLNYIGNQLPF